MGNCGGGEKNPPAPPPPRRAPQPAPAGPTPQPARPAGPPASAARQTPVASPPQAAKRVGSSSRVDKPDADGDVNKVGMGKCSFTHADGGQKSPEYSIRGIPMGTRSPVVEQSAASPYRGPTHAAVTAVDDELTRVVPERVVQEAQATLLELEDLLREHAREALCVYEPAASPIEEPRTPPEDTSARGDDDMDDETFVPSKANSQAMMSAMQLQNRIRSNAREAALEALGIDDDRAGISEDGDTGDEGDDDERAISDAELARRLRELLSRKQDPELAWWMAALSVEDSTPERLVCGDTEVVWSIGCVTLTIEANRRRRTPCEPSSAEPPQLEAAIEQKHGKDERYASTKGRALWWLGVEAATCCRGADDIDVVGSEGRGGEVLLESADVELRITSGDTTIDPFA